MPLLRSLTRGASAWPEKILNSMAAARDAGFLTQLTNNMITRRKFVTNAGALADAVAPFMARSSMKLLVSRTSKLASAFVLLAALRASSTLLAAPEPTADFSRDIRPILSDRCFACHGPDEQARKAKLRLDVRAEALKKAIVPGDAVKSPLFQRIMSEDEDEVMPPPESKKLRCSNAG
jgi:Planctomycete cytochrome C